MHAAELRGRYGVEAAVEAVLHLDLGNEKFPIRRQQRARTQMNRRCLGILMSAVMLSGCGTAASAPPALVAPSATEPASPALTATATPTATAEPTAAPTPLSSDTILSANPEEVSLATLTADLAKSLQDSSFLATTIIPPQAMDRLQSCGDPTLHSQERTGQCKWLIINFYGAYQQSFNGSDQTGTDGLYQVSKGAYAYAVGPDGPYFGRKAMLDAELREVFSHPIVIS